jgi:DNA-binding LytR/AlgR family response regulator
MTKKFGKILSFQNFSSIFVAINYYLEAISQRRETFTYQFIFSHEKITFKIEDAFRVFNVCDIIYLVASGSYTLVYFPKDIVPEGVIQVPYSMKVVLEHCQGEIIRVHKSYSVNPDQVVSLSGNRIRLEQNGVASVSPAYREELLKVLNVVQK